MSTKLSDKAAALVELLREDIKLVDGKLDIPEDVYFLHAPDEITPAAVAAKEEFDSAFLPAFTAVVGERALTMLSTNEDSKMTVQHALTPAVTVGVTVHREKSFPQAGADPVVKPGWTSVHVTTSHFGSNSGDMHAARLSIENLARDLFAAKND
jgi:hypothetical protein